LSEKIERLAQALAAAWQGNAMIDLPGEAARPRTRAEAYAVQDRMAELIGGRVSGWKVGATVPAVQKLEGHDGPIPGRIFAGRTFDSPARVPAAGFPGARVECEFAFHFKRALPLRDRPYTPGEIADALTFHAAMELTGTRYTPGSGNRPSTTHDTIADNGSGGGFVFGPGIDAWRALPFTTLAIEARIDGGAPVEVYTGEYRREPLEVTAETVNDLAARGIAMEAGHYLSTGSLTMPTPFGPGQTMVAKFAGIGELRLTLV
jgi:2-keto-4-pentenoate hydratase